MAVEVHNRQLMEGLVGGGEETPARAYFPDLEDTRESKFAQAKRRRQEMFRQGRKRSVGAMERLVRHEEDRLARLIANTRNANRARVKREITRKAEVQGRKIRDSQQRLREIRQAGRALVERELDAYELRLRNQEKQAQAHERIQRIVQEETAKKLEFHETKVLKEIRQRARGELVQQDHVTDKSIYRKLKHDIAIQHTLEAERLRRWEIEQKLKEEEDRMKEFLQMRRDLRDHFMEQRYRLAREEAGLEIAQIKKEKAFPVPHQFFGESRNPNPFNANQNQIPSRNSTPLTSFEQDPSLYYGQSPKPPSSKRSVSRQGFSPLSVEVGSCGEDLNGFATRAVRSPGPAHQQENRQPEISEFLQPRNMQGFLPEIRSKTVADEGLTLSSRDNDWFYIDAQGAIQGPFSDQRMRTWNKRGLFPRDLLIQANTKDPQHFAPLHVLFPDPLSAFH